MAFDSCFPGKTLVTCLYLASPLYWGGSATKKGGLRPAHCVLQPPNVLRPTRSVLYPLKMCCDRPPSVQQPFKCAAAGGQCIVAPENCAGRHKCAASPYEACCGWHNECVLPLTGKEHIWINYLIFNSRESRCTFFTFHLFSW